MKCMKCSRDAEPGEVFCPQCLRSMAAAPVKPGTPVTIPKRPKRVAPAISKKQQQEEMEALLRKKIRRFQVLSAVLAVALCIAVGLLTWHFMVVDHDGFGIGQNYSAEGSTTHTP